MLNKVPFILLPFNLLVDVSIIFFFPQREIITAVRGAILLLFLLLITTKYIKNTKLYMGIIVFGIYMLIIALLTDDVTGSIKLGLKIIVPMLFFIVGVNLIKDINALRKLNASVVVVFVILIGNFLLSNYLGLGTSEYTQGDEFLMGSMKDQWNLFTYTILLTPLIIAFNKKNKMKNAIIVALALICSLILLVSLKRIAILGLVGGMISIFVFQNKIGKGIRNLLIVCLIMLMLLPTFLDVLLIRLEARKRQFDTESLTGEARYLETGIIWGNAISFREPIKSIFGTNNFVSGGEYGYQFGDRNIHVDYNVVLHCLGFVGLALYLLMFAHIFTVYQRYKTKILAPKNDYLILNATFLTLFIFQFITSLSGQMAHLSFRSTLFLYLGAIVGIFYNHTKKIKLLMLEQKSENQNIRLDG